MRRRTCGEKVYPAAHNPHAVLTLVSLLDDELADKMEESLLSPGLPNLYSLTKNLGEAFLQAEAGALPVAIVRPSIVGAAWQEPFSGWVDNLNGTTGVNLAIGTGILRAAPGHVGQPIDVVPVDFVANYIIASAHHVATRPSGQPSPFVVNVTSSDVNPHTFGLWQKASVRAWLRFPLERRAFRRPFFRFYSPDSLRLRVASFVQQRLLFMAWDGLAYVMGKQATLSQSYERLNSSLESYRFYTCNTWLFEGNSKDDIMTRLSEDDLRTFFLDFRLIFWRSYVEACTVGIKQFIMKEDMARLPVARSNQRRLAFWTLVNRAALAAVAYKFILPLLRRWGSHLSRRLAIIPIAIAIAQL